MLNVICIRLLHCVKLYFHMSVAWLGVARLCSAVTALCTIVHDCCRFCTLCGREALKIERWTPLQALARVSN